MKELKLPFEQNNKWKSHGWEDNGIKGERIFFKCNKCGLEASVYMGVINTGYTLDWNTAISCEEERMRRAIG